MGQNLGSIMHRNVISVSPQQSIKEAAELMKQNNVGSLPVVENGQLKGMLTDRDITLRSSADGNLNKTVAECMTSKNLVTGTSNMDVHEAAEMMSQHKIRRLPVVENNQMVGMISIGDLATQDEYQNEAGEALTNISSPSKPE
ncbi:CBS domain-containing protein [Scopulibacillus daqui]|uniref:CBS domain-containing protein n=1 Tax=Scopulibacillus daqui TaxID=1469162 RepID=A0ABS2Q4T7_9BACL|nr:CBS domain-containing protein [Scopulibacillus daqui]MBM7646845.1 CBS domain-containing protein [Scopulibacillus daqui]